MVATHGDVKADVNRGINCVKGYFLSKIMYGTDRLTQPLLRMKDGKFDKQGEFQPVTWDQAFDIMEEKYKAALKAGGPEAIGMFGSGQWTIWEGYAANKLMKAGFRSNNIDPNARHCMASAAFGFMRTFGMDEPMGCYEDIEAADAFVLWGSNMAEMHPVLWTRLTDRRLSAPHVKVAVMSTFEHRSFELADIPMIFNPQTDTVILNYIANHIIQSGAVNKEFIDKHTRFAKGATNIGYGLRPTDPLELKAENAAVANTDRHWLRGLRRVPQTLHPGTRRQGIRCTGRAPEGPGRAVRRPQGQGDVLLDHGLQPAHPRCLGEQHDLQHPSAHRKDQRAGQQPVLAHRPALGLRHRARGRDLRPPPASGHGRHQPQASRHYRKDLEAARRHHPGKAGSTPSTRAASSRTAC